ncbi:DUF7574 domain-containing protein [Micromonospora sp. CB01531]|uniref:DUF7574 domain-containing protein n=1 Tax=Micromonospora sp. CB01531 TaxID=1718947 RepID=UPI00093FE117|nr:hypothetical protein [Micromonospora sp. CB01531]OKI54545.1 hypothetical protein A6A27_31970 [Micromonospora sp. CB01531]
MSYYGFEFTPVDTDIPGYEVIAEFGEWDYSWSTMRIYKRDSRLFYITDSGCSCYSWEDNPKTEGDLRELPDLNSARNAIKDLMGYDFEREQDTYLNAIEKFRELGLR